MIHSAQYYSITHRIYKDYLAYLVVITQFCTMSTVASISCVSIRINYCNYIDIIEKLTVIDVKLIRLTGVEIFYYKWVLFNALQTMWLPCCIYVCFAKIESNFWIKMCDFIGYAIPLIMRYVQVTVPSMIVGIIGDRLRLLNDVVRNIGKTKKDVNNPISLLIELKNLYNELIELMKMLLDTASIVLLLGILTCFVQCILTFYILYSNSFASQSSAELLSAFVALTLQIALFYLNCYFTEIEAKNTLILLSQNKSHHNNFQYLTLVSN